MKMKMARKIVLLYVASIPLLGLSASPCAHAQQCAGKQTPAQVDELIDKLIAQMTPEERIAQLQDRAPAIPRLKIPAYNWWNEGLHGIARNGYATVFPQAIGLAASADQELLESVGKVVSTEARAKFNPHRDDDSPRYGGLTIWSPNINIFRDPRWGRGQETYGEDPFLTATLASAFIRGIQGDRGRFYLRADATPKHFAVHSGPEALRDGFNAIVSEHDLKDTYLAAFRYVTGEGRGSAVMCSYNAINGIPACANSQLLNKMMRTQWGFNGYIVSDCDAVDEITDYLHYAVDAAHGAAAALRTGVDLNCGSTYRHLNEALQEGLIDQGEINRSLHRLLLARVRLGMLAPQQCSPYNKIAADAIDTVSDRALARRAAQESMVLLENQKLPDGKPLLPLDPRGKTIAVIGPSADPLSVIEANYHGTAKHATTLLEGLKRGLPTSTKLLYAQGANLASGATVPIPRTAFLDGGLQGRYYNNGSLDGTPALVRKEARIDFDFDHVSPLHSQNGPVSSAKLHPYSVRWAGLLRPYGPGQYRIRVAIDRCFDCKGHDGYRLWIDGKLALEDNGIRRNGEPQPTDSVVLQWPEVATHRVCLEYFHLGEDQGVHLEWEPPAEVLRAEALQIARRADVILALVGISPELEGEALSIEISGFAGGDRTDLRLPETQRNLLLALAGLHKPIVLGLTSGSPIATADVRREMHAPLALLQLWYPGEEGGAALGDILTGTVSPAGRLPVTVYRSVDDLPLFTDYSMAHRTYRYLSTGVHPEYDFGFGLSYSRFEYGAPILAHHALHAGDPLQVEVGVRNVGEREADEVVELYLTPPQDGTAPRIELQGFKRIHLNAGELKHVGFQISPRQMCGTATDGSQWIHPGNYRIHVGGAQPENPSLGGAAVEIAGSQPCN